MFGRWGMRGMRAWLLLAGGRGVRPAGTEVTVTLATRDSARTWKALSSPPRPGLQDCSGS
ncbi:hypothetical protein LEMLEM_LOCUS25804 [Lemmus lemmus]